MEGKILKSKYCKVVAFEESISKSSAEGDKSAQEKIKPAKKRKKFTKEKKGEEEEDESGKKRGRKKEKSLNVRACWNRSRN